MQEFCSPHKQWLLARRNELTAGYDSALRNFMKYAKITLTIRMCFVAYLVLIMFNLLADAVPGWLPAFLRNPLAWLALIAMAIVDLRTITQTLAHKRQLLAARAKLEEVNQKLSACPPWQIELLD